MASTAQRSFAKGELAPALHARVDTAAYEIGLRTCRNVFVLRQGGSTKRPGTEYICAVKDNSKRVRLIPFVFNVRDSFVLEFGEHYIRFFQNGGQVVDPASPPDPLEITSPYVETDLPDLQYVQSGDVVTIVHPNYPPQELKRFGDATWTLTAIVFGAGIAAPTGITATDLFSLLPATFTAGTSRYVVTAVTIGGEESLQSAIATSAHIPQTGIPQHVQGTAAGADTYNVYRSDTGADVFGWVGSGTGTTVNFIDTGFVPDYTRQPPIDPGLFQALNDYPSVVAYYQQRLVFANSNNAPDTVWCSRTGFFHNFNKSAYVQDDDAITFRLVSDEVDAVRHVLNLGRLIVGTEGVDWIIDGDGNGVLTPAAVNARAASYDGMSPLKPIKAGARMLFVQAMGAAVRELQSNVQFGYYSLVGGDVTLYSSHLIDGFKIVDWAFQQEPPKIVWAVRSDGVLLGLTYLPEEQMLAWHRHDTKGFIENVCVVPEGKSHWVYWCVKRLINGTYRRYIERQTTSIVLPVFATPEEGASGPVVTPNPPPPAPPPSPSPEPPPTNASTTNVTATTATANWVAGDLAAPTSVEIQAVGAATWTVLADVAAGTQSLVFTGLTASTPYQWRARHHLGTVYSDYLGPIDATRFTTLAQTTQIVAPVDGPVVTDQVHNSGSTDLTITWAASPDDPSAVSHLEVAGPQTITPTDGEFTSVRTFVGQTAVFRVVTAGTYWFRVRYEDPLGIMTASDWSPVTSWAITVDP